jgi:integrase
MICQPVALSGYAEWPKVADAVIEADFTSREITVRQGKGRKDRVVPLVKQAEAALKAYLKVRDAQPEYDEVFIARNGTSMDQRTVRYRIQKYYKEAGINPTTLLNGISHGGVFSCARDRHGDDAVACPL